MSMLTLEKDESYNSVYTLSASHTFHYKFFTFEIGTFSVTSQSPTVGISLNVYVYLGKGCQLFSGFLHFCKQTKLHILL